jgi:hypothetical protein
MSFTSAITKNYPDYAIIHTGVSLGGIIAQHELFNNHKVLAIESPCLENSVVAKWYINALTGMADILAYAYLSSSVPLIPVVFYEVVGQLVFKTWVFAPIFFVAHNLPKLAEHFTNVQF